MATAGPSTASAMKVRRLALDGGLDGQLGLPLDEAHDLRDWGPRVRLACGFGRFARFQADLSQRLGGRDDREPWTTFYGSGDFHHVSLALLRRQPAEFNLLILDKHPDWVRGVPFLHCGTWVAHGLRLPNLRNVFHVGGMLDFENHYRPFAPWPDLRSGRLVAYPAARRFRGGGWERVDSPPIRAVPDEPADPARLERLLDPHRAELARRPLYVSIDKDVLRPEDAAVNWDSGVLTLDELRGVLRSFIRAASGRLAGVDCLGDWSPVEVRGPGRRLLHLAEHPRLRVDPDRASAINEAANLAILSAIGDA